MPSDDETWRQSIGSNEDDNDEDDDITACKEVPMQYSDFDVKINNTNADLE